MYGERCSRTLAAKRVLLEINLTSNEVMCIGVSGKNHPLPDLSQVRRAGGALDRRRRHRARIDLTARICPRGRATRLSYADLKQLVRTQP